MDEKFAEIVSSLHDRYEELMARSPISDGNHSADLPSRGVYLFSENGKHLYVGRTDNLKSRYGGHTLKSMKDQSAPFAFKLACEEMKVPAKARDRDMTRRELMEWAEFNNAFENAKARIRSMEFRWVEEVAPAKQALLEAYCAIVLDTPYNNFENH